MRNIISAGLLAGVASLLVAQTPFNVQVPAPPPGGAVNKVFFAQMLSGETVKGSPYSAEAVTESVQILADGNRIVNRNSTKQYRDSEGRERREMSVGPILSPTGTAAEPVQTIMISDPVAGLNYTLNPKDRTALKMPMPQVRPMITATAGTPIQVKADVLLEAASPQAAAAIGGQRILIYENRNVTAAAEPNEKTEQLGTSVTEGVMAEGTRVRTTIPAGQAGNDKPIEIVSERWFSPDLKMTVMTKHTDPRMGETTFKLTNINRAEPARALFEVPAGYTVNEPPNKVGPGLQIIQREIHQQQ